MTVQSAVIDMPTLAAVSAFSSKDDGRFYLCGVCVEIDADGITYVATDDHRLAARRIGLHESADRNTLTGVWIIPTGVATGFKLPARAEPQGVITREGESLGLEYLGTKRVFRPVDGTFPDWRRIVPVSVTGKLDRGINGDYLASVDAFGKKLGLGTKLCHWDDKGGPAVFTFDGHDAFCFVTPMRQKIETPWARPAWMRARA